MSLRDGILSSLRAAGGAPVSGQQLAERAGVTRNAVWKAVSQLRAEGYEISSATNRGYALVSEPDRLSASALTELLGGTELGIYVYDTIDSTNNEAKRRLAQGEHRFLAAAECQSGGRGRAGKSFSSPAGTGLYMSLAFRPAEDFFDAVGVTTYAAVCVAEAISALTSKECGIKWVNDVFYAGKKVCGILTEAVTDFETGGLDSVVVGIGINLRPGSFPPELRDVAGSLELKEPVKNELCADIVRRLLAFDPHDRTYMDVYRSRSIVLGREVGYTLAGERRCGTAEKISDDGALTVRRADGGLDTLRGGEVSLLYY